ncbi:MAG: hypothetical protein LBL45_00340, partial [Treponema sp.]|nr:hypothetical protein [Treponema sp.]
MAVGNINGTESGETAFFEFNKQFPTEEAAIDRFYLAGCDNKSTRRPCGAEANPCRAARRNVCAGHSRDDALSPFAGA